MTAIDDFKQFIADEQASSNFKKWQQANPGEYSKWASFRDAILSGQSPTMPTLATPYGKGLIDAGIETIHFRALEQPSPSPTNPFPDASGYYFLETFSGSNDCQRNVGGAAGMPWFDNANLWATSLEEDNPKGAYGISYSRVPTDYGYGLKILGAGKTQADLQSHWNALGGGAYGQQGNIYITPQNSYAGLKPGDLASQPGKDMEIWRRSRQMWPSSDHHWMPGYLMLSCIETHDNPYDINDLTPADGGPGSPRVRPISSSPYDGAVVGGSYAYPYASSEGIDPTLSVLAVGGPTTNYRTVTVDANLHVGQQDGSSPYNGTYPTIKVASGLPGHPLIMDHWYDIVWNVKYTAGSKLDSSALWPNGRYKLYVDGQLVIDIEHPTVWWRTTGVHGYFTSGYYLYNCWSSYSRAIVFDAICWGPNASSVGFNPPA